MNFTSNQLFTEMLKKKSWSSIAKLNKFNQNIFRNQTNKCLICGITVLNVYLCEFVGFQFILRHAGNDDRNIQINDYVNA